MDIEQDDTLHEKRFVFEYLHMENTDRFQHKEQELKQKREEYLAMCFRHKDIWESKVKIGDEPYLSNTMYQCSRKVLSVFFKNELMKQLFEQKKEDKDKKKKEGQKEKKKE